MPSTLDRRPDSEPSFRGVLAQSSREFARANSVVKLRSLPVTGLFVSNQGIQLPAPLILEPTLTTLTSRETRRNRYLFPICELSTGITLEIRLRKSGLDQLSREDPFFLVTIHEDSSVLESVPRSVCIFW
jgi:hypothetical protein